MKQSLKHSEDQRFIHDVLSNANNRAILARWDRLALTDGWLVAGCLFQTIWNICSGRAAEVQIKDYDIFYFDESDLTEQAERLVQERVDEVSSDLGVIVEAKNQARVHLWYQGHFGYAYPTLVDAKDGIKRFLVSATCVGIRPRDSFFEVYAPNGLRDLYDGRLCPNPLADHRPLFDRKARSYLDRWPWLTIADEHRDRTLSAAAHLAASADQTSGPRSDSAAR